MPRVGWTVRSPLGWRTLLAEVRAAPWLGSAVAPSKPTPAEHWPAAQLGVRQPNLTGYCLREKKKKKKKKKKKYFIDGDAAKHWTAECWGCASQI